MRGLEMKNADTPAMPLNNPHYDGNWDKELFIGMGLTKREAYAMAAMQGLLASDAVSAIDFETASEWYESNAEASVKHADALLAALEVQP
jgi:hypothetical protein